MLRTLLDLQHHMHLICAPPNSVHMSQAENRLETIQLHNHLQHPVPNCLAVRLLHLPTSRPNLV